MERWRKTDLCIISSRAEALQAAGDAALEAQSVNMKINLVKKIIKKRHMPFRNVQPLGNIWANMKVCSLASSGILPEDAT